MSYQFTRHVSAPVAIEAAEWDGSAAMWEWFATTSPGNSDKWEFLHLPDQEVIVVVYKDKKIHYSGKKGDWVCLDTAGEPFIMAANIFAGRYVLWSEYKGVLLEGK